MALEHNDQVKHNDTPTPVADTHPGATAALQNDVYGAMGKPDAGNALPKDGGKDTFHKEAQGAMLGALNEFWNKPLNAELAHAKTDPEKDAKAQTDQKAMAMLGYGELAGKNGENADSNAANIAQHHRREAFAALFDSKSGDNSSHSGMSKNNDGAAAKMFGNNQQLSFDPNHNRQLSFA